LPAAQKQEEAAVISAVSVHCVNVYAISTALHGMTWEKKRKEKTTPFGVNLMRSQVLYRAAQVMTWDACCTQEHAKIPPTSCNIEPSTKLAAKVCGTGAAHM